jgi:DnaJ-like protein
MGDAAALRLALDLLHVPSRARLLRSDPLPAGLGLLLRIAANDEQAIDQAVEMTERSRDVIRNAAGFFIEQILWCPDADSYRVLGANRAASSGELKRNMTLLMIWLHPDRGRGGERSVFLHRVTTAWNDLKTPERRAIYDSTHGQAQTKRSGRRRDGRARSGQQAARLPIPRWSATGAAHALGPLGVKPPGLLRRALHFLLGRAGN